MMSIPQIEPVTTLQRNYKSLIAKLAHGPVILSQASRAAAVLVSLAEWDRQAKRLAYLERLVAGDKAIAEGEFVDSADVDAAFKKMGIG